MKSLMTYTFVIMLNINTKARNANMTFKGHLFVLIDGAYTTSC